MFELLAGEDQALLVGRDALLVLDLGLDVLDRVEGRAPMWKTRSGWPAGTYLAEAGRGWPRLEVALSLDWRWRGVLEGEWTQASGRLFST